MASLGDGFSDSPLVKQPIRSSSMNIVAGANMIVDPMINNPTLQSAMQILDSLSDLGKGMPFVAPAFILLKIIIDIERKAQDADTKCNDLIERINFMLSHMPVLRRMEVMEPTRLVIDRMIGALKDAAALISAYRRQGRLVRRLSINNRDKFIACAETINACSHDLMTSLQIHQTGQLEILTRAVPIDAEDEAARKFVASHGSLEVVTHSPTLVTQFAEEQHFVMDETVMEQLNVNISDAVRQNQDRLEDMLKQNVGAAVVDGLKGLAAEINAAEAEQRFICVQCDKEFRSSTNGPKSCSFHRAAYDSWNKSYPCCGTSHPCEYRSHRANHHCDYPYGAFFKRAQGIMNYVDTVEKWTSVEDTNLESSATEKASVGRLSRWVSRGARIDEPTILITVGSIWYNKPYFFDTFNTKELASVARAVALTRQTLIFRTSDSNSEFAMAEWVVSTSGDIVGVQLTAKAATSETPYVRMCPIDIATGTKTGEVVTLSEGGLRAYTPRSPYILPETVRVGPELTGEPVRSVRTDFKTRTLSPSLRVILRAVSNPPLTANPQFARNDVDYFDGTVSIFNNHAAGSQNPVTIASVSAFFRLVGDKEYTAVQASQVDGTVLPLTIEPRQAHQLKFQVTVPRSQEDIKHDTRWWNRAFIARKRPIRIKLVLEDIEGEECFLVLEYVFQPFRPEEQASNDLAFLYFDNLDTLERAYVHVQQISGGNALVKISGNEINDKSLAKIVYQALKTGESEIDLGIGQEKNDGAWEWNAWALVDLSCRRVYAFKILLKEGHRVNPKKLGCLGYVACPDYGDIINETRSIQYATEKIKLPELEPYPVDELVMDDAIDDYISEPPKPTAQINEVPTGSNVGSGVPADLTTLLPSIELSLSRIATTLEKIAAKMDAK